MGCGCKSKSKAPKPINYKVLVSAAYLSDYDLDIIEKSLIDIGNMPDAHAKSIKSFLINNKNARGSMVESSSGGFRAATRVTPSDLIYSGGFESANKIFDYLTNNSIYARITK